MSLTVLAMLTPGIAGHQHPSLREVLLVDAAAKPLIESATPEAAVGVSSSAILTGGAIVFVPVMIKPSLLSGGTVSTDWPKDENGNYVNFNKQPTPPPSIQPKPQPTPNTQPNHPQTRPAPQMAEHTKRKGSKKRTNDKHTRKDSGDSKPPRYIPFREYEQPKDDKKKDREKPPYHRKDRDEPKQP